MATPRLSARVVVHLDAARYARALAALTRAHRLWHELDAAAVEAHCASSETVALRRIWDTLADLDRSLDRASQMLTEAKR